MSGEDGELGFKHGDDEKDISEGMPLYSKVDPLFPSSDWDPITSSMVSNNSFSHSNYTSLVMETPHGMSGFSHYQSGSASSLLLPYGNVSDCSQIGHCLGSDMKSEIIRPKEAHEDKQISEYWVLDASPSRKRKQIESHSIPSSQWNKKAVEEFRKNIQTEDQSEKLIELGGKLTETSAGNIPRKEIMNKEKSVSEENQKDNYIHVRARRGQATNSHSLAERVRREKISERMRLLQELVPGCNKITGKAVMLDEIINYVQSLQQQVEFLSMKLATVNPELNVNIDRLLAKEILHSRDGNSPMLGLSHGMNQYLQYGAIQGTIPSIPTTNSQFNPISQTVLETELQSLYQMGFVSNSSTMENFPLNGQPKPEN